MEIKRNYSLDLLRLVLMFMVCLLHVLGQGGVLEESNPLSWRYQLFWLFEIMAYGAVDTFALMSGYFATKRPHQYEKIIGMWFQALFYSFIFPLILSVIGIGSHVPIGMQHIFLVTFHQFWYFTAFFGLFFAMPILNKFLFSITVKQGKIMFILLLVFFSIMGIYGYPFKLNEGYSLIWLIVLYILGFLIKYLNVFSSRSTVTLCLIWVGCIVTTWYLFIIYHNSLYINYISPTIVLSSMILLVIFSRLKLPSKIEAIIKVLSPYAFGIYLFQMSPIIWQYIIKGNAVFIVEEPIIIVILWIFILSGGIFILGLLVEILRSQLMKYLRFDQLYHTIYISLHRACLAVFTFFR